MRRIASVVLLSTLVVCGVAPAAGSATGSPEGPPRAVVSAVSTDLRPLAASAASAAPTAPTAWCGTAAQSDRVPNAVAGNPIHWVYLIPSDASDNLGTVATVMQSDAEQIDAWWRRQDSTRAPRNDLAPFSCGAQLDITTVRSSLSSAQLSSLGGRFSGIVDTLQRAGLTSVFTKYVVYFDGPIDDDNICGQGGSDSSGYGVAIVYYRSCVGVSTAAVAAHEFLHSVGAVPSGAPHGCTGDTAGHTCDDESDIMYPSIGGGGFETKVLDPGRDDYYGHDGGWTDTRDSAWLVRLDAQAPFPLTIAGPGAVTADVPGLHCAASCTTNWNTGQRLVLSAVPDAGAKLVRWGGACSGAGGCSVAVPSGAGVAALFAPTTYRLTLAVTGHGTVRSSRSGITCRPRCSARFPSYAPVRLVATPAKGWKLRSWSGACRGTAVTCSVPMTAAATVRATFVRR